MSGKELLVIPTDVVDTAPPLFSFTLLATHRYRLRRISAHPTNDSATALETMTKQVKSIQDGILEYIDMNDGNRWDFVKMCVSFVPQTFCEFCFKQIGEESSKSILQSSSRNNYVKMIVPPLNYRKDVLIIIFFLK